MSGNIVKRENRLPVVAQNLTPDPLPTLWRRGWGRGEQGYLQSQSSTRARSRPYLGMHPARQPALAPFPVTL